MVTSKKALEIIIDIKFEPVRSNKPVLKVTSFNKLKSLKLTLGDKIEVSGYVTMVGPVHGRE